MAILSLEDINSRLTQLKDWVYSEKSIQKEFELKDFSSALGFVVRAGIEAEKLDHHPDVSIHSWNKVKFIISTHSEGGVTEKDFNLASIIDKLF